MIKRKRKTRATLLLIDIPSNGLSYEDVGDHELDSHVDYLCGKDNYEKGDESFELFYPEPLRIEASKISDMLFDATDWSKVRETYHKWHTEGFDQFASEDLGFELKLVHESEDVAHIPLSAAKRLLAMCKRDKLAALQTQLTAEYYDRDAEKMVRHRPLTEWDRGELGCLLKAALELDHLEPIEGMSDFECEGCKAAGLPWQHWVSGRSEADRDENVYYYVYEDDYEAWGNGVDWPKFEKARAECRQALFDELSETDFELMSTVDFTFLVEHGYVEGYPVRLRCPLTLELPLLQLAA